MGPEALYAWATKPLTCAVTLRSATTQITSATVLTLAPPRGVLASVVVSVVHAAVCLMVSAAATTSLVAAPVPSQSVAFVVSRWVAVALVSVACVVVFVALTPVQVAPMAVAARMGGRSARYPSKGRHCRQLSQQAQCSPNLDGAIVPRARSRRPRWLRIRFLQCSGFARRLGRRQLG